MFLYSDHSSVEPDPASRKRDRATRRASDIVARQLIETLECRQLLSANASQTIMSAPPSASTATTALASSALVSTTVTLTSSTPVAAAPIVVPTHIVVVVEEDRYANAIGDTTDMPYINSLANSGLVYSNSHGLNAVSESGQSSYLGLYSGSTQGVADDFNNGEFDGGNLAQSLASSGRSFSGYVEALPYAGDTTDNYAADPNNPAWDDLYIRAYNPMAQFSDVGAGLTNADVNQPYSSFPSTATGFAALPTVSFIIPDTAHNTHGSNDTDPYATDPAAYDLLRQNGDTWLQQNLDSYLQWAKQNNSLLIVTGDEGDRAHNFDNGFATIINGASGLFVPGVDTTSENQYNLLRTIEDMYNLPTLGNSASAADLDTTSQGKLGVPQSAGASVVGQLVSFTATVMPVDPAAGTPTGPVQFVVDGSNVGSPIALVNGAATSPAVTFLAQGNHSVSAVYGSDASFAASTAPTLTQSVTPAATLTSLSSSAPSAIWGQSVILTATVTAVAPGSGTPTGAVTFFDGPTMLGAGTLDNSGTATFTTSSLSVASHSITAVYGSDSNYTGNTSAILSENVSADSTTVAVISSSNPSAFGQSVTFTATVSPVAPGAGIPTGTVTFLDGVTTLGMGTLDANGQSTLITATLSAASHAISVMYAGNGNFTTGTSTTLNQSVTAPAAAGTTTALSSSPNPSVFGQAVTFTAAVTPAAPSGNTPTGTIQFVVDGFNVGSPVAMNNGVARSSALSSLAVGGHTISALYSGDVNFSPSTATNLAQTVNASATNAALQSSSNPSVFGQSVTLTATVSIADAGSGTPGGLVTFMDGATTLGTGGLNASGKATFTTSSLSTASHSITAASAGSANFSASTSAIVVQQVTSSAPANDNFASATTITGTSATLTGTNLGATKQSGEPNHAGNAGGHSVWYTWTAPAAGKAIIDTTGSNFDTLLAVYTGSSVSVLTAVTNGANNNNPAGGTTSIVTISVVKGTVYRIAVDGTNGATGNITLHLVSGVFPAAPTNVSAGKGTFTDHVHIIWTASSGASGYQVFRGTSSSSSAATQINTSAITTASYDDMSTVGGINYYYWIKATNAIGTSAFSASATGYARPANDNFANATIITGASASLSGGNMGATKQSGEPSNPANSGGKSVWYSWTAPKSGTVTIDTHGSSFNTLLTIFTGSSLTSLTRIAANDNDAAGGTVTSKVSFKVTAGITYRIAVDGYSGQSGTIMLHLNLI